MNEQLFGKPHVLRRLKAGPVAGVLEDYLDRLEGRGYSTCTIQQYVQAVEHFARWLSRSGRVVADADEAMVENFLSRHLPRCRCAHPRNRTTKCLRAALRQLLAVLEDAQPKPSEEPTPGSIDVVLKDFDHHLAETCGAAAATRRYRLRETRSLLVTQFGDGPVDLTLVTGAHARAFVTKRAERLSPASANVVATAIRSFGRYLQFRGLGGDWTAAILSAAQWRLAHLPRVLNEGEIDALLSAFDRTRPQGLRDYAMALCLLDLGLRASEVAALKLDDVAWRSSILHLPAGKTHRGRSLPMPERVAQALADYVQRGRLETTARALFVNHRPPRGQYIGPTIVRSAIRLAYGRAGLDPRLTGTHVLRHTAATRLLAAGASIKEIADLMGHRSIDTTMIYAKVDVRALAEVALPWPEVQS